jgi:uncharacterized protein YaaR (DUF327 family)
METSITKDLGTLRAEILIFKNQAAMNMIEIGMRLIEVKEQLPHGEFGKWVESEVSFSQQTARKFMKVAREMANNATSRYLDTSKAFELLALPEEQRDEFIESNPVEDMTVKELREAIKARKEAEERAQEILKELEGERKENTKLRKSNTELLTSKPEPEIITKEVTVEKEVIPSDYNSIKEKAKKAVEIEQYSKSLHEKLKAANEEVLRLTKAQEELRATASTKGPSIPQFNVLAFMSHLGSFVQEINQYIYKAEEFSTLSDKERTKCLMALDKVDTTLYELRQAINGSDRTIVEVDVN